MEDFQSKYSGEQVEGFLDQIANGDIGGGITVETDPIFSASPAASITEEKKTEWDNKVDKVDGKQLSTEDFTTALKNKLNSLNNYDDTEINEAVNTLREDFDTIVSGDTTTAIKSFNDIIAFLNGIEDSKSLDSIIASIQQQIAGKMDKVTLAAVATSGDYNDLNNKPTIPNAVTESTVSGWGFTKNTGTYIKPSTGIPKTDLASAVQTSLAKADTALQTETYKGTVTGVKVNGTTKNPSNGVVDLGTVITSHQDISGKQDKLVSGINIKTINGKSILEEGDLVIEGGFSGANVQAVDTSETLDDVETNTYVKYVAQTLTEEQKAQARENIGVSEIGGNVDLDNIGFVSGTGTGSALQKGSDERGCEASGDYSIAGGQLANATGTASVALGRGCKASGGGTVALGGIVEVLQVTGKMGALTYTTHTYVNEYFVGCDILAPDGIFTTKLATIQSVFGNQITVDTTLSADADLNKVSFAVIGCRATASSSVALCQSFMSSNNGSYAEGRTTISSGKYSHAEGDRTMAIGNYSHSEGSLTKTKNNGAHAEGYATTASGKYSHAEGAGGLNIYFTGNNKIYTIEIGTNIQNSFSFVKGIVGKSIMNSKNIIIATVLSSEIADDGYTTSVTLDTDLGELKKAQYAILFGGAYGDYSHSENISLANGGESHSQGESSIANGYGSFIHGSNSVADGITSAVFGTNNYAQNNSEFALGISNHSHTGESSAEQTLFSVGCGDWQTMGMDDRIANQIPLPTPEDGKNALEIMRNGDIYLGGYGDGIQLYNAEENKVNENLFSVDLSDYYNKSEIDNKLGDINTILESIINS